MGIPIWKLVAIGLILVIGIQFIPVERTNPPLQADLEAPAAVKEMLRSACYNCHSNETRWPWYGYVAPTSWFVAHDVNEAREELNFSKWGTLHAETRRHLRREMWELVEKGEMPLPVYAWIHSDARLSPEQKATLRDWAVGKDAGPSDCF